MPSYFGVGGIPVFKLVFGDGGKRSDGCHASRLREHGTQ